MKLLKQSGGIILVNYLMLAAAVIGASHLAVQVFDEGLVSDLDTKVDNFLGSLGLIDTKIAMYGVTAEGAIDTTNVIDFPD